MHCEFASLGKYFSTSELIKYLASIKWQYLELFYSRCSYWIELVVVHSFNFPYNNFLFYCNKVISDFFYLFSRIVQNVISPYSAPNRIYYDFTEQNFFFLDYTIIVDSNDQNIFIFQI